MNVCLLWSDRFDTGCPEGVSCDSAHSLEELQEWTERRDFLRQKLAKAREDMLVMPDEFDFGKYNFLLQNWEDSWVFFRPAKEASESRVYTQSRQVKLYCLIRRTTA